MKRRIRRNLPALVLAAVVLVGIAGLGVGWWVMESHAVDLQRFEQIRAGMTQEQVRGLVGQPASIVSSPDGFTTWTYSQPWSWCMAKVEFDGTGRVVRKVHDH